MNSILLVQSGFRLMGIFLLTLTLSGAVSKNIQPTELGVQEAFHYRSEGRYFQEMGQLQEALSAYQKAVVVYPGYAQGYNEMGVVLESLGREREAVDAYHKAIELDPGLGSAHTNLALWYERTGNVQKAAKHWSARVMLGPAADPWVVRARQRLRQHDIPVPRSDGKLDEDLKAQIKLAYSMGIDHMRHHRWEDAAAEFERVLELNPDHRAAKRRLRKVNAWIEADSRRRPTRAEIHRNEQAQRAHGALKSDKPVVEGWRAQQDWEAPEPVLEWDVEAEETDELLRGSQPTRNYTWGRPEAPAQNRRWSSSGPSLEITDSSTGALSDQEDLIILPIRTAPEPDTFSPIQTGTLELPAVEVAVSAPEPEIDFSSAEAMARAMAIEKSKSRGSTVEELYQRGVSAMRDKAYGEAVIQFEQVLSLEPEHQKAQRALKRARTALEKTGPSFIQ